MNQSDQKSSLKSSVQDPYHVWHVGLKRWALATVCCAILLQACARPAPSDKVFRGGEHMWTKARVDILVAESRECALLARYAELNHDDARAARYYQQAWCLDRGSTWLQQKRNAYVTRGMLDAHARCYTQP